LEREREEGKRRKSYFANQVAADIPISSKIEKGSEK
jgi:hypothetical protein